MAISIHTKKGLQHPGLFPNFSLPIIMSHILPSHSLPRPIPHLFITYKFSKISSIPFPDHFLSSSTSLLLRSLQKCSNLLGTCRPLILLIFTVLHPSNISPLSTPKIPWQIITITSSHRSLFPFPSHHIISHLDYRVSSLTGPSASIFIHQQSIPNRAARSRL